MDALRWTGATMLEAKKGFQRLKHLTRRKMPLKRNGPTPSPTLKPGLPDV